MRFILENNQSLMCWLQALLKTLRALAFCYQSKKQSLSITNVPYSTEQTFCSCIIMLLFKLYLLTLMRILLVSKNKIYLWRSEINSSGVFQENITTAEIRYILFYLKFLVIGFLLTLWNNVISSLNLASAPLTYKHFKII